MTPSPSDRRARGIAMREARMARVSGIRRRVVASALALFVATWLLITMLLVSGHDPALARTKTATTAASPATTTTTTTPVTTRTSPAAASGSGTGTTTTSATATAATSATTMAATSALTSSQS